MPSRGAAVLNFKRAFSLAVVLLSFACKGESGEEIDTPEQSQAAFESVLPELTSTIRTAIEAATTAGGGLSGQAETRQHSSSLLASQNCPGGGTVQLDIEAVGGGRYEGTSTSSDCVIDGTTISGTLTGSITLLDGVTRFDVSGTLTLSGGFNGTLTVHSLVGEASASGLCFRADVSVGGLRATVGTACGSGTDAGVDAGQPLADSGQPGPDAGGPSPDAGQTGPDAGPPATCGNGQRDEGELCDDSAGGEAACPASCPANSGCNRFTLEGSSPFCNVRCINQPVTACQSDDACCPSGCSNANDNDCMAQVGPGFGETCTFPPLDLAMQCVSPLDCVTDEPPPPPFQAYCTKSCGQTSDCPSNAFCGVVVVQSSNSVMCRLRCQTGTDCPAGHVCEPITETIPPQPTLGCRLPPS